MNTQILKDIMNKTEEPFVSEADFQFYLAEQLRRRGYEVILEYPMIESDNSARQYIDIAVKDGRKIYFIELKYKTKRALIERYGIKLGLKDQAAQNLGRIGFVEDIERMEKIAAPKGLKNPFNFCILLTNDQLYWKSTQRKTLGKDFRLDKELRKGKLAYKDKEVRLGGSYSLKWADIAAHKSFKYLLVKIKPSPI